MEVGLTIEDVVSMLQSEKMRPFVYELHRYIETIVDSSLSSLRSADVAQIAWQGFANGVIRYSDSMLINNSAAFADYPEVILRILNDGFTAFHKWFLANGENEEYREQAIIRNLFHFFDYLVHNPEKITRELLDLLPVEFAELDFSQPTFWLSKFYNGLQACIIEVYVVEVYFRNLKEDKSRYN